MEWAAARGEIAPAETEGSCSLLHILPTPLLSSISLLMDRRTAVFESNPSGTSGGRSCKKGHLPGALLANHLGGRWSPGGAPSIVNWVPPGCHSLWIESESSIQGDYLLLEGVRVVIQNLQPLISLAFLYRTGKHGPWGSRWYFPKVVWMKTKCSPKYFCFSTKLSPYNKTLKCRMHLNGIISNSHIVRWLRMRKFLWCKVTGFVTFDHALSSALVTFSNKQPDSKYFRLLGHLRVIRSLSPLLSSVIVVWK